MVHDDHLAFSVDFRWYSVARAAATRRRRLSAAHDAAGPQRRHRIK
jgi:hypothetical protein